MFRHLEVSHGKGGLEKCWKFSVCEFQSDGHKLNVHFKKEHPENRLIQSRNVSNQTATPNPPEIGEQFFLSNDSLIEEEYQQLGTATSPISERNKPQMERSLSPQVFSTETIGAEVSVNERVNETTSSGSII